MDNLASKYRPKTLDDVVEQSVVIDIVKNICKSDEITNRNFLFIGPAGTGKALAHGEPVLTESGFKKIEEIKVGDRVITHTGAIACVSGVFPQGSRPIYEIELADGAKIRVSDNHLNIVSHCCEGRIKREVVTTDYLLSHNYGSFSIPVADIKDHLVRLNLEDPRRLSVHRNIVCIRGLGMQECTCIYVNHPDHSFITRDFIPTHNTSTARAIARTLNDGELNNVIELDAASHSGVTDVRELTEQMKSFPVGSKYKVFILDEVHSFSNQSWQVLLKVLEEQPARTISMLCTTNPEKIPATILSRVQTFQLSKISLEGIFNRLKYIVEQENKEDRHITYSDDALYYIAKLAQGGLRDSITNLDQCLAYCNDITVENVMKALNLPDYDQYFELLNAIAKKNNEKIIEIINSVYNSGVNFVKWFDGFFSFVTNIVKFIYLQDINQTMIPSIYQDKIAGYGTAHSALCLKLSNKLVKMNQELKTTQYLQELAISYLCTPPAVQKGQ